MPVGGLLLKFLIHNSIVNTSAIDNLLRENLTSLDTYIATIQSNIETFNKYVKVNADGMKERGEMTDNLIINLLKDYEVTSDKYLGR